MTMKWVRPPSRAVRMGSITSRSKSVSRSGTSTQVAPQATPTYMARWPAWRPITSTTEQRSWDCMVSRSLSMESSAVLQAVSKPMV